MRFIIFIFYFIFAIPCFAQKANPHHIAQGAFTLFVPLAKEIPNIPASLLSNAPTQIKPSSLPKGVLAKWDEHKNYFLISKRLLKQWTKQTPQPSAEKLASCLLPLWLHEATHARSFQEGKSLGFVWPFTLEDEAIATYWQIYTQQALEQAEKFSTCHLWVPDLFLEKEAHLKKDWPMFQQVVFERYSAALGRELPPPLIPENLPQEKEKKQIFFSKGIYPVFTGKLSLKTFLTKGGKWTDLSRKNFFLFLGSPSYLRYQEKLALYTKEILLTI